MQKEKLIIIFTVLVDVLGFGIVIPILPFYLTEFGAGPLTVTFLFSIFSFFSFLCSPFLGALSDRVGRRPILLLSIFSTAVGWFVFASATSILFLFIGRIIDGIAAGNFTIAQSYLVDISKNDKERASNLGIIGAAFGIGFMLGPLLGGILSKVSHSFPFYVAGGMALLNFIFAYFMLPETNFNRNTTKLRYNPIKPLISASQMKGLRSLYSIWIIFSIAFVITQSIFALFSQNVFGFNSFQTGLFFTIIGIIVALNQTVFLKRYWLHRFTEQQLLTIMMFILFIGISLMGTTSLVLFFAALPFLGTGQAVLRVVIASQAVAHADANIKGEVIGVTSSIMSFAMIIGPIIGGYLFELNFSAPFLVSAALLLYGFFLSRRKQ